MLTELASAYHDYHFYRPGSGEKEWQLYLKALAVLEKAKVSKP